MKRACHDAVRSVKRLLNSVSMVHIDVNVEDARMVPQELENSKDDIVNVAEPGCLSFLGMMQSSGPVDGNVALVPR